MKTQKMHKKKKRKERKRKKRAFCITKLKSHILFFSINYSHPKIHAFWHHQKIFNLFYIFTLKTYPTSHSLFYIFTIHPFTIFY